MASPDDPSPPPRVRLPQGTYEGRIVTAASLADPTTPAACPPTDVDAFLGIPYAQSTAGDRRFAAPVPLAVAPGDADRVHAATQLGQRCPSSMAPDPALRDLPEGEDCLNVNVYRPHGSGSGSGTGLLPVVVYVHGGSFNGGLGAGRDMASFVGYAAGRVVGVSFNYRLGALGFLGWLADPASADAPPLNAGLLDQQALFAWVQANIGFFGGDPGHVTLMGLSAGAHAVAHHMLCYAPGQAPFHKVVCESGAATARSVWDATHPRPQAQLRAFLAAAGVAVPAVDDDDDATATATATVLAALRALPLATIVAAARHVWDANQASLCWPFQPVVDGRVLPVPPSAAWAAGARPGLPVLTGFCSHEGTYFVPADRARADTDAHVRAFFRTLLPAWTDADDDAFGRLYPDPVTAAEARYANPMPSPPGVTGRQWTRLEAAYAHYAYICPVLETARVVAGCADAGAAAAPAAPVFVYEYAAHALPWSRANHGDNQLPVAHNVAPGPTNPAGLRGLPGLTAVADAMHGAWVAFATAPLAALRAPGGLSAGGVAWPAWTPAAQPVMVFGAGNNERVPAFARPGSGTAERGTVAAVRTLTDDERAQCAFWRARRALSEGTGQAA